MPKTTHERRGGSFAPPLSAEKLAAYAALVPTIEDPQVKEIMKKLHALGVEFQKTPSSTLAGSPHPSGMGEIVRLEPAEIQRIWDLVPWDGIWSLGTMSLPPCKRSLMAWPLTLPCARPRFTFFGWQKNWKWAGNQLRATSFRPGDGHEQAFRLATLELSSSSKLSSRTTMIGMPSSR